jgi:hypothetical protein
VYLLFLVLGVIGNEKRKAFINATLLEEFLKLLLEVKVESFELTRQYDLRRTPSTKQEKGRGTHLRTDEESTAFPISLGGEVRRQLRIIIVRHVFDNEHALLANSVDTQCTGDRRLIKTARQRRWSRGRECVYAHTLVTVIEQRSGYDGSPVSAEALPSSS